MVTRFKNPGLQIRSPGRSDGKVIVASDRKKLVETFSRLYPGVDLNSNEIKLEKASNEIFRAIIPILGLNKHLGLVVLEYLPPAHPPQ